jgi:carbon-monoxide dehydrogenase catalytic subunit
VPLPRGKEETAEERKKRKGVCGATAETIAARNFARMTAAGSATHGDHGRRVAELFEAVAEGKALGYSSKMNKSLN